MAKPDLNSTEHAFSMLKKKLKGTNPLNKQESKVAAVGGLAEHHRRRFSGPGDVISRPLQAVSECKGYTTRC